MSEASPSHASREPARPQQARDDFALVIPAFDEAEVAPILVREVRDAFERHGLGGEVLFVDDGSTDGTADAACRAAEGWGAFRLLRHRTNLGKTEAMLTAARATDRGVMLVFDADLQHSPDEIPRLLDRIEEGWDIVCGRKVGTYEKQAVSSLYNRMSRALFDVPVSDLNSIKAFRTAILREIPLRHDWHRFFVVLAHARGYRATEIDVALHPRRAGRSKYTGRWRVVVGVMDLLSVWFLLVFSRKPLLLFGTTGAALIATGSAVGLVAVYLRLVHATGYRPLLDLVLLCVTVGVMLVGFGLLAEMVAQLREEMDELRRRSER